MNIIQTTEVFDNWFSELKDRTVKAWIQARIDRAEDNNFGDCGPVGEGVSEMRIHTQALDTGSISNRSAWKYLCCWQAETRPRNNRTSRQQLNWPAILEDRQ